MPETNVTTAITAAIPITTPSSVSTERSLFAHRERSAMRMASAMFMRSAFGLARRPASGNCDSLPDSAIYRFASSTSRARYRIPSRSGALADESWTIRNAA